MKFLKKGSGQKARILFAHGAGAPMDSDWMNAVCEELSQFDIQTLRFEFPYMQERRISGKKRPPNKAHVLEETWSEATLSTKGQPFFLMGKSMGCRIASHIANTSGAKGLIALGFPFHPPGKPLAERHLPLMNSKIPTLILQGERDTFGNPTTIKDLKFKKHQKLIWIPDGDHSFKPRKASGKNLQQNIELACTSIVKFIEKEK